nr:hypothetical protein [Leptospira kirschneri]
MSHSPWVVRQVALETQFYRGFVATPTDLILRSKYLWGWLWS